MIDPSIEIECYSGRCAGACDFVGAVAGHGSWPSGDASLRDALEMRFVVF